jgi:hypothetical protein
MSISFAATPQSKEAQQARTYTDPSAGAPPSRRSGYDRPYVNRDHWNKVFTQPEYFDSIAKQKGMVEGAKVSLHGDDYVYRQAMMGYLSATRNVPIDDMRSVFDAEKDGFAQKVLGKKTATSRELFEWHKTKFERENEKSDAARTVIEDVTRNSLQDAMMGSDTPFVQSVAKSIEATGDLFTEEEKSRLWEKAEEQDKQIRATQAAVAPEARFLFSALGQTTGQQAGMGAPDMREVAAKFAQLPDNQRKAIYELVGGFAQLQQVDKGFWYQMAESLGRGTSDIIERVPRNFREQTLRGQLRLLESDQPVFGATGVAGAEFSAAGSTPVFGATQGQMLTPEEREQAKAKIQSDLGILKVEREIRDLAERVVDPIKTVTFLPEIVEEGLYGAARSIPYTVAAAIPFAGIPAVAAALFSANYDRIMVEYPDLDPDKAALIAAASAPIEAVLERLKVNTITGRLPVFGGLVKRLQHPNQRNITRIAIGGAGIIAEQNVQEIVQNATFPFVQTVAAALDQDMPDYDWAKQMENYPRELAVQFVALLPLSLMGMGALSHREMTRGADYIQNKSNLEKAGYGIDQIDRITGAATADEAQTILQEESGKRDPKLVKAAAKRVLDEVLALREKKAPASLPRLEKQGADYVVLSPEGKELARSTDQNYAEQALVSARRETVQREMRDVHTGINEAVEFIQKVNEARQRGEDVAKVIRENAPRTLLTDYEANPTQENLDRLFETVRAFGQEINEPAELASFPVIGSNQGALAEGIWRSVIRINEGADGTIVMREFAQDNLKRAISEGRVTMDFVRQQLNDILPQIDSNRIKRQLRTETDTDVIEAFSDIAVAYFRGSIREEQIPAGLRGIMRRLAIISRDIFRRAYNLARLRAEGKLDRDFEALLAEAVGVNQQALVDRFRERTEQEVGAASGDGVNNYSIAAEPSRVVMGININDSGQDFTGQILRGDKTIETRATQSLNPYVGERVGIVRTGVGRATLVGYATIGEPITYLDEASFRADESKHRVSQGSEFDIGPEGKFGYPLLNVESTDPKEVVSRGIVARSLQNYSIGISPAMDTDYLAAVERGDMEMAQRMVDEAGGWVGMVGADPRVSEDPESLWKEYETKNYGGKYSSDYMDIFETKNGGFALSMSKTYPYVEWSRSTAAGRGRTAYLELLYAAKTVGKKGVETQSFAESKAIGAWKSLERRGFISLKESSTEDRGEDGVYTVFEATILPKGEAFIRGETDPVTYDASGNVIPLSQRFDSTTADINYSIAAKNSLRVRMTRQAMTDAALAQESWKDWYEEHQAVLDEFFGDHAQLFQDILSITSQAASVKANVGLALRAFGLYVRGEPFDGMLRGEEKRGFLPAVIKNLERHRENDQLQGQKIRAYKASNDGEVDQAVVDRHIAQLIFGVKSPSKAQFAKAQKILSEIANEIGWTPRQVQAALWAHSIYKSGKTPQSYGDYLKQLESRGTIEQRIGDLGRRGPSGDADGGGRGRYAPDGAAEGAGVSNYSILARYEGTPSVAVEGGRPYSPIVRDLLQRRAAGEDIPREVIDQAINENFPAQLVEVPRSVAELPDRSTIDDAIDKGQRDKRIDVSTIEAGEKVAIRQDVPAMTRKGVGVVTVKSKAGNSYEAAVRITEPDFILNEKKSLRIAMGEAKGPHIVINGKWAADQSMPADLETWTQVGYNPDRHSFYYDRATMQQVTGGSEAYQIGNTVFVKDAQYGDGQISDISYSISTQSEIDRVQKAMGALDRSPLSRLKVYEKMQERFLRVMSDNRETLAAMEGGDLSQVRRTQILQALGELDGIISALPAEIRAKIGGYTQLAKVDPMDVFKGDQKVSEVRGMSGAIISAWMREGLNIGQAQKKTELPAGYRAERNLDPTRADRAIADIFIQRINRINEALEKFLRDEYNDAAVELFKRAKPQRSGAGEKPKGKLGATVHELFDTLKEATEWSAEKAQAWADGQWARIESGELNPYEQAHATLAAQVVPLFADWANADSTQRAAAVSMGKDILDRAYKGEQQRIIAQRTKRGYDRTDLSKDAGVSAQDDKARQNAVKRENSLPAKWEAAMLNLLNFDQVLRYVFGNDSKIAQKISDRQRKADNVKSDDIAALSDDWASLLTRLGGGEMQGQQLLFDLSRMDEEIDGVSYSQNQLVAITMMWMQPKGRQHMEGFMDSDGQPAGKWHYNQAFVNKAEKLLRPESKVIREYLLLKYDQEYEAINKVYRKVYGLNLPKNQFYSPLIVESINAPAQAGIDPVTGGVFAAGANSPSALRSRGGAVAQPVFRDAVQTYFGHMLQMAHWKAYAEFNGEVSALLGHRDTRNVVKGKAGEQAATVMNTGCNTSSRAATRTQLTIWPLTR